MNNILKIKIRKTKLGFQVVPSFLKPSAASSDKDILNFYISVQNLFKTLNWLNENAIIILKSEDKDFKIFNEFQSMRNSKFRLTPSIIKQIEKEEIDQEVIPNVKVIWDLKALQLIYSGIIPYFHKEYFQNLFNLEKAVDASIIGVILQFSKKGYKVKQRLF